MPYFQHPKTKEIVEFSEEFADSVIRRQGHYKEVTDEPEELVSNRSETRSPKRRSRRSKKESAGNPE